MTDATTVTSFMEGYLKAWNSNAPEDIRALFTDDAQYRTAPFDAARLGTDAIVAGWIEDQDQPGDFTFNWHQVGLDGDTAFVQAETVYADGRTYANLWVIVFADDGRATSYTEWYMRVPDDSAPHPNA